MINKPVIVSEYREVDTQKQKSDRQRRARLKIRDVESRERIFTLIYIMLIIVSQLVGVVIGYLAR